MVLYTTTLVNHGHKQLSPKAPSSCQISLILLSNPPNWIPSLEIVLFLHMLTKCH